MLLTAPAWATGRRLGWGVLDQALSSLSNFALTFLVARSVTPARFGAFNIAFTTYLVALGLSRAIGTEPLSVRYSRVSPEEWRSGVRSASGVVAVIGVAGAVGCLAFASLGPEVMSGSFFALAAVLPGVLVQDCWRFAFFAAHQGSRALINDLVWAASLALLLLLLLFLGDAVSVVGVMLAWGAAGTLAGGIGCVQVRALPDLGALRGWWRAHRDLSRRFVAEFATSNAAGELTIVGIGLVAGLPTVAALRAGLILLGPLSIVLLGLGLVAVPEGARSLAQGGPPQLMRVSIVTSMGFVVVAVLWAGLVSLVPESVGVMILGENWQPGRALLLPLTLMLTLGGSTIGATAGLRALAAAKRGLRARTVTSALLLVAAIGGAAFAGGEGAAWGYVAAISLGAVFWWREFFIELRAHSAGSTPGGGRVPNGGS